jgi:hypothetical protein
VAAQEQTLERTFTGEEWGIRRLAARDPSFRACWEQYEEALHFAEHWRATAGTLDPRTRDYTALVEELEKEIQQRLGQEEQEDEREDAQ